MHNAAQIANHYRLLAATLEPLRSLIDDPAVVEIMCNGSGEVWFESSGEMSRAECEIADQAIQSAAMALTSQAGRSAIAGTESGIVDAEIPLAAVASPGARAGGNMRVAVVMAPTALRGSAMSIRKHNPRVLSLDDYFASGSFSPSGAGRPKQSNTLPASLADIAGGGRPLFDLIRWIVRNRYTVLISGATGSGKTTFFKALIKEIPDAERLLTIEDTPELVVNSPNFLSLVSNVQTGVTPARLVKLAMRMRPDRILLGELRDATALDFLEAANTGHPGSIATLHANDGLRALTRLETLALQAGIGDSNSIRSRILDTVDFVVQVAKDGRPGMVEEVLQVTRHGHANNDLSSNTRTLFSRYAPPTGAHS